MAESRMARLLATEEGFWEYRKRYESPPVEILPLDVLSRGEIPIVEAARAGAAAAEAETGLARSRFSPQVNLNGSVGYRSRTRFETDKRNQEYSFGVSVSWDLTDAGTQIVRVSQLRAQERAATAKLEQARARHWQALAAAELEKMQAEEMVELQKELTAMAGQRLDDMKQSFEARIVTRDDLLAARQELASEQMELRRAQMQASRQTYLQWLTSGRPPLAELARSAAASTTSRSAPLGEKAP
jgi:outer membrane protein TolC